jgi:N-acetylglucosamine-6-phosphate deacetylase
MNLLIKNARAVSPGFDEKGVSIEIHKGRICAIHPAGAPLPETDAVFDAQGQMVLPGFIDIHTHGAMGCDFCDGTLQAVETICETKLKEGTTTLLPTTLTLSPPSLKKAAECVAEYALAPKFCKTPGLHLEGPFISRERLGGQNPDCVRPPDIDEVRALNDIMPVAIVSLAIEVDGALEMIRELNAMGIIPSAAHSNATREQFAEAKEAGLRHLTHFCNQMSPLHHREIGLVGCGLIDDDILLEMICDKIHLCPDMIELVLKIKSTQQLALVTDTVLAAGMPDGTYDLGGLDITVKNGIARLVSNDTLAGSTLKLHDALKNVHAISGLPLKDLVRTTSWNQAQSLGLPDLGKIEPGFIADLVVLDDAFQPVEVFVDGKPRLGA